MPYKIISFDADGTLVDHGFSRRIWEEEIPRLYAESRGISMDEAEKKVFQEFSQVDEEDPSWYSFEYWFDRLGLGDHRPFIEAQRGKVPLYPEVTDVLDHLSQDDFALVVSSNAPRELLEIELEPISRYLDHVFSASSDFNRVKVDSEYYRDICFFLGVEPEEMVHVGDRWIDDVISPEKAGVSAVFMDRKDGSQGQAVKDLHGFASLLRDLVKGRGGHPRPVPCQPSYTG